MIAGTCEELSDITKRSDCAPASYVRANLDNFYVESKELTSFFDFVDYNHPDDGVKYTLQTNRQFL